MKTRCSKCRRVFDVKRFETRQLEDDLYEVGFECSHCDTWYHSFFLNKELRTQRNQLQRKGKNKNKREELLAYQRQFVAFNERVRAERGMKVKTLPVVGVK